MTKVSVIHKLNNLFMQAMQVNASDIHFETFEKMFRVRYRIDGVLQNIGTLPFIQKDEFIARIKILADLNTAEKRKPQDGKFTIKFQDSSVDMRVSIIPTLFGEKAVLRLLHRDSEQLTLKKLGLSSGDAEIFQKHLNAPYGMILVTGPTGSGKTTTLYSALQLLNTEEINITTIEDPIEYQLTGINQTHVRNDIGYTFSNALRSLLRQDPDVIMVGEMRDPETAEIAIRSALTGHLVFSTIHTNDAPSTITRLVNMGIEKYLLSSSLKMIIAQRLVRTICSNCKKEYRPPFHTLSQLALPEDGKYYIGEGCENCNNTGYKGRTGIFEIFEITPAISEMILSNASENKLREAAVQNGMKTLLDTAREKILSGVTNPEEIIRKMFIYAS